MIDYVEKLLRHFSYEVHQDGDKTVLFARDSKDFIYLLDLPSGQLINFFESPLTQSIVASYKRLNIAEPASKRNTTLLVFVKLEDFGRDIPKVQNSVYRIEEDEFYFRKHVVFYTGKALKTLREVEPNQLQTLIANINKFNRYHTLETRYKDESYFVAMQLFSKLAFLSLDQAMEVKDDLVTIIDEAVGEGGLRIKNCVNEVITDDYSSFNDDLFSLDGESTRLDTFLSKILEMQDED